jgi:hypothetical protein
MVSMLLQIACHLWLIYGWQLKVTFLFLSSYMWHYVVGIFISGIYILYCAVPYSIARGSLNFLMIRVSIDLKVIWRSTCYSTRCYTAEDQNSCMPWVGNKPKPKPRKNISARKSNRVQDWFKNLKLTTGVSFRAALLLFFTDIALI